MDIQAIIRKGLTMIEALVIIIVLGVAAAIVVPRFSEAKSDIRSSAMRTSLKTIQAQISLYRVQHQNRYPALATFTEQMTLATDDTGQTAPSGTEGYPFGPYLQSIPVNPYTGGNHVGTRADETADWHYDESTGEFRPNDFHPSLRNR